MSEAIDQTPPPNPQLDWAEQPLPTDPYRVPLENINMADARYFQTNTQFPFFKRLREEDPVHLNTHPFTGDFWSVTKFEDILYVDKHWEKFSSANGIALGCLLYTSDAADDAMNV